MADNIKEKRAVGTDCGTMFFQTAEQSADGEIDLQAIRNAFVQIEATEDIEEILTQNKWQYVKDGNEYFVIGEDSMKVAKLFPGRVELRRPMQDGVLNKNEEKKMLVMAELIESSIGKCPDDKSVVCTCVSSESVDGSADSRFHRARLIGMFKRLGWNTKVIEEGLAVILSERPTIVESDGTEAPYSGIGISFGAGRVNCVLAYKGLQVLGLSAARCLSKDFIVKEKFGLKKIKDIKIGDFVYNRYGELVEVIDKINNGYRDSLLRISISGLPHTYEMTEDHRVLVYRDNKWVWVRACNLRVGDEIGEPTIKFSNRSKTFYFGRDMKNKKYIKIEGGRKLGKFLGAFLGDGCTNIYSNKKGKEYGYVSIAFNQKDEEYINEYIEILNELFSDNKIEKSIDGSVVNLKIHNTGLAKYMKNNFYNDIGEKILKYPLENIPDQMLLGIISGLLDSDGNVNNRDGMDFNNTSLQLAEVFHSSLNRFGIKHSWMTREPRLGGINDRGEQIYGRKSSHVIRISGLPYKILKSLLDYTSSGLPIAYPDFIRYNIKNIDMVEHKDNVYDLTVDSEDHSFSSSGIIVHNCGDWIDDKVSEQLGVPISQVTSKKEKELDFNNLNEEDDVIYALNVYYEAMIEFVFKHFARKFKEVESEFDAPLSVVVAGGTSMPKGFCTKVEEVVKNLDLPFEISEVKHASDPRNSVVKGCLTQAMITQKKIAKTSEKDDLSSILGE